MINTRRIKKELITLAESCVAEKGNKDLVDTIGYKAADIMYENGFDKVIPEVNLRVEFENPEFLIAFRTPRMAPKWAEIRV